MKLRMQILPGDGVPFDLGDNYILLVRAAGQDDRGITAQIECHNGTKLHSDRVLLSSKRSRQGYAKPAAEKITRDDPATAPAWIDRITDALLELETQLPATLATYDEKATDSDEESAELDPGELWRLAKPLAENPKLLDRLDEITRALGLVGEQRNARLLYLASITRLLEKPVSMIVKGPSSAGKSYLLKIVTSLLPPSAYLDYTAISAKYLAYSTDDLRHRIVVIYEAGGISDGTGAYIMRSLLSEGRLDIGTVEKEGDGDSSAQVARRIEKEGPTALWTSTTRTSIDDELETRALGPTITDTESHSREILRGTATGYVDEKAAPPALTSWHAFQNWLAIAGEKRVRIPFAGALAELVPAKAVRIRRDFGKLLGLIEASAILFQAQRERNDDGAIVATLADYAIVRDLLLDSFTTAQNEGITDCQREAWESVAVLQSKSEVKSESISSAGVRLGDVADALNIDKSAASRRLKNLLKLGYIRDLNYKPNDKESEKRRGKPASYVTGDPLPEKTDALPTVEAVKNALREVML